MKREADKKRLNEKRFEMLLACAKTSPRTKTPSLACSSPDPALTSLVQTSIAKLDAKVDRVRKSAADAKAQVKGHAVRPAPKRQELLAAPTQLRNESEESLELDLWFEEQQQESSRREQKERDRRHKAEREL